MLKTKRIYIAALALAALVVIVVWGRDTLSFFSTPMIGTDETTNSVRMNNEDKRSDLVPDQFAELTIPFLRGRKYQSSLSELEKIASLSSHTTYLTAYDSDGLRINGLLTIPVGEQPDGGWPAIVFVHGYIPPDQYRTQEKYVEYVNTLARNGFVVFKIDLRGHGDSEGEATGSYYSSGYVIDTLNAVAALESAPFVNADTIGLWGHSMAGNIVLRSIAARPELPAAVIWGGAGFSYSDLQKYGLSDNSYRRPDPSSQPRSERQRLFEALGEFDTTNSFWQSVAATSFLGDLQGALQLHHAEDDTVVNIGYSRDLAALLEEAGTTHEFYEYTTGGHNISGSSFTQAMSRTIDFYNTQFKN